MRDWARTALSGRYAGADIAADIEADMRRVDLAARAVVFPDDWLAPRSSLRYLLAKLPRVDAGVQVLDAAALGTTADHFSWLRRPEAVARALLAPAPRP